MIGFEISLILCFLYNNVVQVTKYSRKKFEKLSYNEAKHKTSMSFSRITKLISKRIQNIFKFLHKLFFSVIFFG